MRSTRSLLRVLPALAALALALALVVYPQQSFRAAAEGLQAWWKVVLPSLLPFFVVSELLLGLGMVNFLGVLLEPVMRPFFNLPGQAAFVVAMGFSSGAPIGAALTARLYREGSLSREEGERLVSFTNNASPLFLLAAVPLLLDNPRLGPSLALSHYLANLTLGFLWGRWNRRRAGAASFPAGPLGAAWRAMLEAQRRDGRPFGQLLGDAVRRSMETLTVIGGFIIFFSVLIRLLELLGVLRVMARALAALAGPLGLPAALMPALAGGALEMTNGARLVGLVPAPPAQQALAVALILGWAGLSVHAQAAAMLAGTGIRLWPYFLTRAGQALLSALYLYFLLPRAQTVWLPAGEASLGLSWQLGLRWAVTVTLLLLAASLASALPTIRRVRLFNLRTRPYRR